MEKKNFLDDRGAGILMPISSLASPYGIGTLGEEAYHFVDRLVKAGQKYWQVLPGRTNQLWGQPVSVIFGICRESVFYRSGYTDRGGTSIKGRGNLRKLGR